MMSIPRFLLTAGASGSGKTLITCGILQALQDRGLTVASFKCGPDYIDPMFHTKVLGTRSRNLDTFFTDADTTRYLLERNSKDCDVAVMEGVMGYYDGVGGNTSKASAYELANITRTPAVLIVNCKGMSVSILPYIKGFAEFKKDSNIQGVLLNQMSPMLYPRVKKMIEDELGISVYGCVPKVEDCVIESRHLGLVLPEEVAGFREKLKRLAEILEKTVDLDRFLELGKTAPALTISKETEQNFMVPQDRKTHLRIGVALDEAFCFMYEDNLQFLRDRGAELVFFSPIHEKSLPQNLDGLLLYGGYPELSGKLLEENARMREEIKKALEHHMPVMAECGGFMYLHEFFENMEGELCHGVGVIKGTAYRTPKLSRFGYIEVQSKTGKLFGRETGISPAHEFHYFDSENSGKDCFAQKPGSSRGWECLHCTDTMLAGFPHFYYYGNPKLAEAYLDCCKDYQKQR